jgi:hypothetical protein
MAQLSEADQRFVRDTRARATSPASAFGAAASAEGTTDDTAQTPEATPSSSQQPPAQGRGEAPAPTGIAHGELRTWTARNGKYTVEAVFVAGDELSVTLGRDGKQRKVPLAALCQADQQFVRDSLAAASPTLAQGHAPAKSAAEYNEPTSGWDNLIDSSSFDKWTTVGAPGVFKLLPDATIRGAGGRAYLVSPDMYSDFELTGRMKVSHDGNGGIFFGVPSGTNLFDKKHLGYEVQLNVRKAGEISATGSIWVDGKSSAIIEDRFEVPDRWYSFSIRCQGPSILIKIDDQIVFDQTDPARRVGNVALQCYQAVGEVQYADMKIRALSHTQATSATIAGNNSEKAGATEPFAVFGIKAGMTIQETITTLKSRGINVGGVSPMESVLRRIPQFEHIADRYRLGRGFQAHRQDGEILTLISVGFCEDLPDRPGVGVCTRASFTKWYQGDGKPDLTSWFRQAREELVKRYGEPADERESFISFGDDDSEKLTAELSLGQLEIQLESREVKRRCEKGQETILARFRPAAPDLKVDF